MVLLCCKLEAQQAIDCGKLITSLIPLFAGIITIIFSLVLTNKNLNSKKQEEEQNEIYKKLNEFYGPLQQLRLKSLVLYNKFSTKFKPDGHNFKTLTHLLDGNKFTGNDEILLKEIISIGEQSEKLIQEKSGLIDDANLRLNVLPRATAHFLIIRLAYGGLLQGESDKFLDLTYPAELDGLLEKRKRELEERLAELAKPSNPFSF